MHFLEEDNNLILEGLGFMELDGNIDFYGDNNQIIVGYNSILTIKSGSVINFHNGGNLIINHDGNLIIEDNVTIGGSSDVQIIVNGNIQIGENVEIENLGGPVENKGLVLNNTAQSLNFNNVTFSHSGFESYCPSLALTNSTLNDCFIVYVYNGNFTINSNYITNTWLKIEDQSAIDHSANIWNSTFVNNSSPLIAGLSLSNFTNYQICFGNTFSGYINGIQILNSGGGIDDNHWIYDNSFEYNTISGITIYDSYAKIDRNLIQNNNIGVRLLNRSSVQLTGSENTSQQILNNSSYEVYISRYSFPSVFWHNEVIDDDNVGNPYDPLVYHNIYSEDPQQQEETDGYAPQMRYNYWGIEFDPIEDFNPTYYPYLPIWNPGENNDKESDGEAETLYIEATANFEQGNFLEAENEYKQLIEEFPDTRFAQEALKKLFALEKFNGSDYLELKSYYDSNDSIVADSNLNQIGKFLSNKCNLKLENWPSAIEYNEDRILNPLSFEDSIFALIDLGYTYLLMENTGYKSTYIGKLANQVPVSKEQYLENKEYLLSLLPGKLSQQMIRNINSLSQGKLLQNVPNPFTEITQIWYKLDIEATVQINIYSYTGQLMNSINVGTKTKGSHYIDFDANRLINGIYFYTLAINGQTTDSKKMTIMK